MAVKGADNLQIAFMRHAQIAALDDGMIRIAVIIDLGEAQMAIWFHFLLFVYL